MKPNNELNRVIQKISEDTRLKNKLKAVKAEYYPKKNAVELHFHTVKHCSPKEFLQLESMVNTHCSEHISIVVNQSCHVQEITDHTKLEKYVKDYVIMKQPAMLPFISNASLHHEKDRLDILFDNEMGKNLFVTMGLKDAVQQYFKDSYGETVSIQLSFDESMDCKTEYTPPKLKQKAEQADAPANMSEHTEHVSAKPIQDSTVARDTKPREKTKAPKRAPKSANMNISPMNEMIAGYPYHIEGEVIHIAEDIQLKDGKFTKKKFVISDYTTSVLCYYIKSTAYKMKFSDVSLGDRVVVSGMYDIDTYERGQNTLKVNNIRPSNRRPRMDTVDKKRVELHAHTQMSAQDGICDVKKLIARAAKWGHKAIAITDHGVVQAFPDAAGAAKKHGIKVIYGVEGYMIDDHKRVYDYNQHLDFEDEYIVFDIETTGLSPVNCDITEIGAVKIKNGKAVDRFSTFVKPASPIPAKIVSLTGITDDMVKDAPSPSEALAKFHAFCGEHAVLVAHNAEFDTKFIFGKSKEFGYDYNHRVLDTIALCRVALPQLKNYKLNTVAAHFRIPLQHHRAVNDAECTAEILLRCFEIFRQMGAQNMNEVNTLRRDEKAYQNARTHHIILLVKNKRGLRNLYKLISHAHIDYFYRRPRMPKSLIEEHREGLIIGSACENGDLYSAVVAGADEQKLKNIASFYDYLEIQPTANNEFMVEKGILANAEAIQQCNQKIVRLGEALEKPVVATCDVHFIDPHEEYFRRIINKVQGFDDSSQPPLFFRTTDEMLEEFSYLGSEKAYEIVVENTNLIADMTEEIELFQSETAMPVIQDADKKITELAFVTAQEKYGDPLPEIVRARLERELDAIVTHGFSVLYYSAHALVKKSNEDGYLVGSRGSVGSSLAATMTGITEVNPLPPHYVCPNCKHSDFSIDKERFSCGVDLPDAVCPHCGTDYEKDGYDIPFEVFLGINADKVPDIDLNFSGEYQANAHKFTEQLFGAGHVFRAGTISAIKDKIAYGYVKKYLEETGTHANDFEVERLIQGISGIKKTTGQHPGGMVIVPADREVYEFTPVQKPADSMDAEAITTHFDFNSMHDILIKLDILGHDVPTIIRILQDLTGVDPLTMPLDDKETMKLFSGLEPLGITPDQLLGIETGTLGIPEFGTKFVRQMLMDTKPSTMAEIVRISGLSHGTDVWLGNAQDLIKSGTCTLSEAICTRDDIMNYLVDRGIEKRMAFFIMEKTRKGQVAKNGFSDEEETALKEANIKQWFLDSCRKIKYMFPKAHAVAYVIMAYRIAYCKVHYKEAFYASYFSVRSNDFDASFVLDGLNDIKKNWRMLEDKGKNATANEKNMASMLEVACEMYLRGVHFLPVDLKKSDTVKFLIEDGSLRLPFVSVPRLGESAAQNIVRERELGDFISVEDLKKRTRISSSVIEEMEKMGTLAGLTKTNQISLFDI